VIVMSRFDTIAYELGWDKPFEGIKVYTTLKADPSGYYKIAFPTLRENIVEDENDTRWDAYYVKNYIEARCCHTKCDLVRIRWALPMCVTDYFAHQGDFESELVWAKVTISVQEKVGVQAFSRNLRDALTEFKERGFKESDEALGNPKALARRVGEFVSRLEQHTKIEEVVKRYNLLQLQSDCTKELYGTWFSPDKLLYIEGVGNKFRISPNTSDMAIVGHIDFSKHYYEDFEDAAKALLTLTVKRLW
jgi:hypothetical protein